jgi:hypothetical protein
MMSESFKWWFIFYQVCFQIWYLHNDIHQIFARPQYLILHQKKLEVTLSTKEKHVQKKTKNMLVIRAYNP